MEHLNAVWMAGWQSKKSSDLVTVAIPVSSWSAVSLSLSLTLIKSHISLNMGNYFYGYYILTSIIGAH